MTKASKVLSALYPADEYLLRIKKKSLPCQQKEREAYELNLTTTPVGQAWPRPPACWRSAGLGGTRKKLPLP